MPLPEPADVADMNGSSVEPIAQDNALTANLPNGISDPEFPTPQAIIDHLKESSFSMMKLYVIRSPEIGLCKIGITDSVSRRLRELQGSSAYRLDLILEFECPEVFARAWEKYIHHSLGYCRTHGEWFKLTEVELDWLWAGQGTSLCNVNVPARFRNEVKR